MGTGTASRPDSSPSSCVEEPGEPPASASSRQAAAPTTPPWLLGNDAPSPQACPSTDACPVCLCEFPSHAHGPETPFLWPGCGHALHLGCVAHLVANVRELRCPTCRAPWPPSAAEAFTGACHTHGVPAPQPAPDHDTTSRRYHEAVAPRPPAHILPFCCPRLFLADSAHEDAAWQELPDRHMHWVPVHSRQTGRWAPEWVCMRCSSSVDECHPLLQGVPIPPTCPTHGPRRLAIDLREFSRGWALLTKPAALQTGCRAGPQRLHGRNCQAHSFWMTRPRSTPSARLPPASHVHSCQQPLRRPLVWGGSLPFAKLAVGFGALWSVITCAG